jgi:TonB family protein
VTLLFVVDANGAAGNVRVVKTSGNPEFDALIIENVKEWEFSPAIKKNKRVKCLVQQPVVVKWSSGSPFRAEL